MTGWATSGRYGCGTVGWYVLAMPSEMIGRACSCPGSTVGIIGRPHPAERPLLAVGPVPRPAALAVPVPVVAKASVTAVR